MFTSEQLTEGQVYTRDYLRTTFKIKDATINTGVFHLSGSQSIWLFITENKAKSSTQYKDQLHGDTLYWDGQKKGRTDQLIVEHETKGLEILVFYRKDKQTFSNYGFRYEGCFRYISQIGSQPTHFVLQRVIDKQAIANNDTELSSLDKVHTEDKTYSNLASEHEYALKREKSSMLMEQGVQLKLVYCYAHEDKALLDELQKHLKLLERQYKIASWHDQIISAGTEWEKEIDIQLDTANIILLLVSPDFMASDYCSGVEMRRAIERHERGVAKVVPVILRPIAGWKSTPIGKLQALPSEGKPVTSRSWYNLDEALLDVAEGLERVINQLILIPPTPPTVLSLPATSIQFASENGRDPLVFRGKEKAREDAYREWVLAHPDDGLIVVKNATRWRLHHATCHHILDPIDKGQSLLTYTKICSTSRAKLDIEATKQGGTILTGCYCQQ